jgi:ABC-type Na+ efflux pump permease subunit
MKKKVIEMIPYVGDEPVYKEKPFPQNVADLTPDAIKALKSALQRVDKTGCADKVAVDAAKFVVASGTVKDSDEYKKMLSSFREMIMKSRKKEEIQLAEVN